MFPSSASILGTIAPNLDCVVDGDAVISKTSNLKNPQNIETENGTTARLMAVLLLSHYKRNDGKSQNICA